MTINEKIHTLTRDFTTVIPKPKSMVRKELIELCKLAIRELLEKVKVKKIISCSNGDDCDSCNTILEQGFNQCLSDIEQRAEELLGESAPQEDCMAISKMAHEKTKEEN